MVDFELREGRKAGGLFGGVSMALAKFAFEIRMDRNFMTSHSIVARGGSSPIIFMPFHCTAPARAP